MAILMRRPILHRPEPRTDMASRSMYATCFGAAALRFADVDFRNE
jgi:hypothetical protein